MLSPEARTVAIDLLRPPAGYRLDSAILTTYSLDLEALLALPLAVLSQADEGIDELLADPLLLFEALREAGERIHIFVDKTGIAIPRNAKPLYAMLESSVHPVQAPHGGAFHPKVWVARFGAKGKPTLLRVAILSRNLTFDRSWDMALASEATPSRKQSAAASRPLKELLQQLPALTTETLPKQVVSSIQDLAEEVGRTRFPSPKGFEDPVTFHDLGLGRKRRKPWLPQIEGFRVFAISPFVTRTALDAVADLSRDERILVSRQEELDKLPEIALKKWDSVFVLSEAAHCEDDDAISDRPSGLHAKAIAIDQRSVVTWYLGSANLTTAAFTGANVEMMASITGPRGRKSGKSGSGIERFLESGFDKLCAPYHRNEDSEENAEAARALKRIEEARDSLVEADLVVRCSPDGDGWTWQLEGKLALPPGVEVRHWPISIHPEKARPLELPSVWSLPISRLTCFVAFKLSVPTADVDDLNLTLKLPAKDMPKGRMTQVLRTLIDSPERFLRFLRALLGGLEGMVNWSKEDGDGSDGTPLKEWFGGDTLLEDLVRAASRDPARLKPVRRLIKDLRSTEEGRKIIPDELFAIWTAVDQAISPGGRK